MLHGSANLRSRTADEPLVEPAEANGLSAILPPPFERAAVEHYCRREWAVHLADVMIRRTSWHYYHNDAAHKAEQVAGWMAEIMDWPQQRMKEELRVYSQQ